MKRRRLNCGKIYKRRRGAILLVFYILLLLLGALLLKGIKDSAEIESTPAPQAITNPISVETEDHGILPVTSTVVKSGRMDFIKALVEEFISMQPGKYGVSFIDLATGESFGINHHDSFVAASTSKLPMNVMLFTKLEDGTIDGDSKLVYCEEDYEPGTGILQNQAFGAEFTVKEASRLSIVYSDNCAINMIIRVLGIEEICQYILDLGGEIYYDDGHLTSPHDLTIVAKELYRLYLNNPGLYGELINNLENTAWNDRIKAQLPFDVKVAHKIGNQVQTFNDVGIVFAAHPYALAVMADNTDNGISSESSDFEDIALENIAKISRMIYDEVERYSR